MPRQPKARNWCFTLNNPGDTRPARPDWACFLVYQLEQGENGTPHLQGYIQTTQKTLAQMKVWLPGAHFEAAKGTPDQNIKYCTKEPRLSDPVQDGEARGQGKRNDVKDFVTYMRAEKRKASDILTDHPHAYDKYPRLMEMLRAEQHRPAPMPEPAWREWQSDALRLLDEQNDRNILWVCDYAGNRGKSFLARYLVQHRDAIAVNGTARDIACAYDYQPVVVVDLPRASRDEAPYGVLEDLKNGQLFSSKYQSRMIQFSPCKVVVFANCPPNNNEWTPGRCTVLDISNLEQ